MPVIAYRKYDPKARLQVIQTCAAGESMVWSAAVPRLLALTEGVADAARQGVGFKTSSSRRSGGAERARSPRGGGDRERRPLDHEGGKPAVATARGPGLARHQQRLWPGGGRESPASPRDESAWTQSAPSASGATTVAERTGVAG
jgi:hypothetical protein